MNEIEKRQLIEALVSEVQIYEERQLNGQWIKSIKFRLPIIEEDISVCLDNGHQAETVILLVHEEKASDADNAVRRKASYKQNVKSIEKYSKKKPYRNNKKH
ncbi:MAG: hypothetical protein E7497_04215 [Ruminococcus sp.]|nr:hypothetical protein [Ruminococcus sp.]